jgi:hypothetical protein
LGYVSFVCRSWLGSVVPGTPVELDVCLSPTDGCPGQVWVVS